jgi:hypothetical protein
MKGRKTIREDYELEPYAAYKMFLTQKAQFVAILGHKCAIMVSSREEVILVDLSASRAMFCDIRFYTKYGIFKDD